VPVATILAIAMAFWNNAGYAIEPQTWDWENKQPENGWIEQGHAYPGSNHVTFNRLWWDTASNEDRCIVGIHELGHSALNFRHEVGTVMDPSPTTTMSSPGICKRSKRAWRATRGG